MVWPAQAVATQQLAQVMLGQAMQVAHQSQQPEAAIVAQEVAQAKPDVIVFQRPMAAPTVQLMRQLQRTGYAIVVDVDDDFTCLDPSNPAYESTDPKNNPIVNRDHHKMACDFADVLTVSTPNIKESYGGGERVHIIRNAIPEHWLAVNLPKDEPRAILWSGVKEFHGGDLELLDGQLGVVCSRTGAKFRNMGGSDCSDQARGFYQQQPFFNLTEMQYTQMIARCSVGIAPLVDRPFNRSKSYVKGLEYSAFGLPFVASPLPEYEVLTELGAGELADHPKQWRMTLERLLNDPEWRAERGAAGREVARTLTVKKAAPQWLAAWEHAAVIAKQRMSA